MTLWSDLETDFDNLLDGLSVVETKQAALAALEVAQPAIPDIFDDLAEYTTYIGLYNAWVADVATARDELDTAGDSYFGSRTAIAARIPIPDVWFKISRGGTNYLVGLFTQADGSYELRYEVTT